MFHSRFSSLAQRYPRQDTRLEEPTQRGMRSLHMGDGANGSGYVFGDCGRKLAAKVGVPGRKRRMISVQRAQPSNCLPKVLACNRRLFRLSTPPARCGRLCTGSGFCSMWIALVMRVCLSQCRLDRPVRMGALCRLFASNLGKLEVEHINTAHNIVLVLQQPQLH